MGTAKVVSLKVMASQASLLCFEVGGIIGESNAELGATVAAFDFEAFYTTLSTFPTHLGDPSGLIFDSLRIQSHAKPFTLLALRAEAKKAALNKAAIARTNAHIAKYGNVQAIMTRTTFDYSPNFLGTSKPDRLARLRKISQEQADQLQKAYSSDDRTGVVMTTQSKLSSTLESSGSSSTTGDRLGRSDETDVDFGRGPGTFSAPPQAADASGFTVQGAPNLLVKEDVRMGANAEHSSERSLSTGTAIERQLIENKDYAFRIPFLESQAQNERAQISLIDEQFAQFMSGLSLPNLGVMLQNELRSIDSDVLQLQIAYLNTILMSPLSGTVTGIYKHPGDCVAAGEPVIRVENNADILLVATLIYRGPILIGSDVVVETMLFDLAGPPTSVKGKVVAVRGQREDDQWEVIVKCGNIHGGKPIFPLGYHFDYDNTKVVIA